MPFLLNVHKKQSQYSDFMLVARTAGIASRATTDSTQQGALDMQGHGDRH